MKNLFKKIRLRSVAFLLLIIYLAASLITSQFELMTKKAEYAGTLDKQEKLQAEVDETKVLLEDEQSRIYIERIAREKLGYGRPGEILFIDVQTE